MRPLRAHSNVSKARGFAHPVKCLTSQQLERARAALLDQLSTDPSLTQLDGTAGLSNYHFARAFKASTGLPPHRYLVQLRIDRARILLETTNLPITEIAAQVGYDDPGYLSRLFRRQFGTTPAKYRRDLRF
jgi:AraC family transcriptional regulator